jgi:hypothetical protein
MRVVAESFEKPFEILVDVRVVRDVVNERVILFLRGKLAMPQQIRDLEERRFFG